MQLRGYQSIASACISREWQEVNSTLVDLFTGGGKTVLFADVIRKVFPARAMVIAHREELINQARDKIHRVTGLSCEVEMGDYRSNEQAGLFGGRANVIVSTVQTQTAGGDGGGRMGKFDPMQFGALIIDEAHHATAASYRRVIDYYRQNPKLKVLGVTATPDRADEEALGQVFDTVAFTYGIEDGIRDGWLCDIEQQMVNVQGLDFSSVRTTAGDLNGADLAAVMEAEKVSHEIASTSIEIIGSRRALVFTSSVKHAEITAEIFNRHRPGMAAWVCGKTDKDQRRQILSDFAQGRIQVVCNCGVLTEGFDDPGVEVVIMGRPTKSRSLYAQMVGRVTRPLPGVVDGPESAEHRLAAIKMSAKTHCLVVDFVGNSGKHKLVSVADILGGKVSEQAIEAAKNRALGTGKPVRMSDALLEEEDEIEKRKQAEIARRARLTVKSKYTLQAVSPFDVFGLTPAKSRGWDNVKTLTEKQRAILTKTGIDPDSLPYAQSKQLIDEIMNRRADHLCTFKQAKLLRKHGFDVNVSFTKASEIIDALARNNWKRTAELEAA